MKVLKCLGVILGVYVGFVVVFETFFLGMYQPKLATTGLPMLVITTMDDSGVPGGRRLARFETGGKLYVSAHHWTRGWYHQALENPNVRVEIDGAVADYLAVPVEGKEFERVAAENPIPLRFMFLMGFPPQRDLLRLEPAL
jgi:uncharacterized pyridoxamine 5'-phosphate oxidase family protein